MSDYKYVIVRIGEEEHAVLFSKTLHHDKMAQAVGHMTRGQIVSAGFTGVDVKSVFGVSESLNMPAYTEDLEVLQNSAAITRMRSHKAGSKPFTGGATSTNRLLARPTGVSKAAALRDRFRR